MRKLLVAFAGVLVMSSLVAAHAECPDDPADCVPPEAKGKVPSVTAFIRHRVAGTEAGLATAPWKSGSPQSTGQGSWLMVEVNASDALTGPEGLLTAPEGQTITFEFGDTTTTAVTDGAGYATGVLHLDIPAGSYTLRAAYDGDEVLGASSAATTVRVRGIALVYTGEALGRPGTPGSLAGTITYDDLGIEGLTLSFAFDGVTVGTATTNSFGTATLSHVLPAVNGIYPVTVSFAGDPDYRVPPCTNPDDVPHGPSCTPQPLDAISVGAQFTVSDVAVSTPTVTIATPEEGDVLLSVPALPEEAGAQLATEIKGTASASAPIESVIVVLRNDTLNVSTTSSAILDCTGSPCTWSHYTNFFLVPGQYSLTVTATASDGGQGSSSVKVFVI